MGHHTAQVTLTLDHAAQARAAAATQPARTTWGYGYRSTFESEMVTIALGIWRDEAAGRWDSANAGNGFLAPNLPREVISNYLDSHHGDVVTASVVIPVITDTDVRVTTKTVKVPVTAAELAKVRAHLAANPDANDPVLPYEIRDRLVTEHGMHMVSARVVKTPAPRKPVATTTDGKARTVYRVMGPDRFSRRAILATKATQAEARAAALSIMEADLRITKLDVIAEVIRVTDDGTTNNALLTVERPVAEGTTIDVELTFHHAKHNAKVDHYSVFFSVHS